MRFIEVFAGIGGIRLGLEKCGHTCVWSNEIDKNACQIYRRHFGEIDEGDIKDVEARFIPDHDLLVGGFPCQAFSIAGNRRGFNDTRGTLFFEICRIIKEKRPRYLLLENVKAILSHNNGNTIKVILSSLNELGYDSETMVLDGINYSSGRRQRMFIYGTHRQQAHDVRERAKQTSSLYSRVSKGSRITADSIQEVGGGSERIIRTFAKLPGWLDSWDPFYTQEKVSR